MTELKGEHDVTNGEAALTGVAVAKAFTHEPTSTDAGPRTI
jgi:hypothetical protein